MGVPEAWLLEKGACRVKYTPRRDIPEKRDRGLFGARCEKRLEDTRAFDLQSNGECMGECSWMRRR